MNNSFKTNLEHPNYNKKLTVLTNLSDRSPLGSLATVTSGLSSGGGGRGTQLYPRLSIGTPTRSY